MAPVTSNDQVASHAFLSELGGVPCAILVLLLITILNVPSAAQYSGTDYTRIARPELSEKKKARFDPEKYNWEKYVTGGVVDRSFGLFLNSNTIAESPNNQSPQNESSIAISPLDPDFLIASAVDSRAGAWVYISRDGGESWENVSLGVVNSNWQSGNDPSVGFDHLGNAYVMYGAFPRPFSGESGVYIAKSTDNGETWVPHIKVIEHKGVMTPDSAFEDKYYIEIDRSLDSPYLGWMYTPWKRVTDRDSATEIVFTRSTDGGETWSRPVGVSPRQPGTSTHITFGQSFPLVKTGPFGEIYAVWNDGPARSIGFARSTDGGSTWSEATYPVTGYEYLGTDRFLTSTRLRIDTISPGTPDERFDTIQVTDTTDRYHVLKETFRAETYPTITVDGTDGPRRGRIYLCWSADRNPNIYFISSDDSGRTWTEPIIVQSETKHDQWWPWISLDETNGDIAVMYSDSRNDPENILIDTYVSYSSDGGQTWVDRRATDAMSDFRDNPFVDQVFAGDYSGNAFHDGMVYPSFLDTRDDNDVYTAVVNIRAPLPVENLTVSSAFEQLSRANLTWNDPELETTFGLPLTDFKVLLLRDGDSLALLDRGVESFVDDGRTIGEVYEYSAFVVTARDTSVIRTVEFEAGKARLPAGAVVENVSEYRPTIAIDILLPAVRADSITPLGNLDRYKVYRDDSLIAERSVARSDSGSVVTFEDTPGRGYYAYQVVAVDAEGNESVRSEAVVIYAGTLEYYALDEDRPYPLLLEGTWGYTSEIARTGTISLTDFPDRDYRPRQSTSAQLFPVESTENTEIRFSHIAVVRSGDSALLEYSIDSGQTWIGLAEYNETDVPSWSDGSLEMSDWREEIVQIPVRGVPTLLLRFRLSTSTLGNDMGWFIDDIEVRASSVGVRDASVAMAPLSATATPNPSRSLPALGVTSRSGGALTWSIYDQLGQEVLSGVSIAESGMTSLVRPGGDGIDLAPGTYYCRVRVGTELTVAKFVILP